MKRLSIIYGLTLFLVTEPAFPLSYRFDFNSDEVWDIAWFLPLGNTVQVEIWLDDYSCPPDDELFGAELYFNYDNTEIQVNQVVPNDTDNGGPFDPEFTIIQSVASGVYMLSVADFSFVTVTGNKILLFTIELERIDYGSSPITTDNEFAGYPQGSVIDCNVVQTYPTDGNAATFYYDYDADGISDDDDKCPCHPNGLNKGTCVKNVGSVIMSYEEGDELITCDVDLDCTPTGGYCQKVQGDCNWNGIGDVCEGYADFDDSGSVNLIDLLDLIICYGKTNFETYPQCEQYDINDDNRVSAWDYIILTLQYGRDGFDTCGAGIAPARVAKTGQNTCYDSGGTEINCLDTGQDGEYQKGVIEPSPRFTDHGDDTITDNLTGLIWTQNAQQVSGQMLWSTALTECNDLDYSTYTDWRLPNTRELLSLIDYGEYEYDPALPSGHPFFNVISNLYWTSTTEAFGNHMASCVEFFAGVSNNRDKSNSLYVWCVRGETNGPAPVPKTGQTICYDSSGVVIDCAGTGQDGEYQKGVEWPTPRFTDNEDGTVTDNLTGLIWLQDANCMATNYPEFDQDDHQGTVEDGRVTWQHALDFVSGLNDGTYSDCAAGYTDWRLLNVREPQSLIHYGYSNPSLSNTEGTGHWSEGDPFTNVHSLWYWSSTTVSNTSYAWDEGFYYGLTNYSNKSDINYYVWPVRGGQ